MVAWHDDDKATQKQTTTTLFDKITLTALIIHVGKFRLHNNMNLSPSLIK